MNMLFMILINIIIIIIIFIIIIIISMIVIIIIIIIINNVNSIFTFWCVVRVNIVWLFTSSSTDTGCCAFAPKMLW